VFDRLDRDFPWTRQYTAITETLQLLDNALVRLLESWQLFEQTELHCFFMDAPVQFKDRWSRQVASIEKDVTRLSLQRTILHQHIETFKRRREGVY